MASAILLRRFLDKDSEFGVGGAPFAKDTVKVISAVLKTLKTSDFQKVLADSLRFAPEDCSAKGDFQRANLSKAYLGGGGVILDGADFYQANLSGASFKGLSLKGAQFCEANLSGTVFANATMEKCNFRSATLQGTSFKSADLSDATFDGAVLRNVDFTGSKLDGASFKNAVGYGIKGAAIPALSNPSAEAAAEKSVFVSRPGILDVRQQLIVDAVKDVIRSFGLVPKDLARDEYDQSKVLANLAVRMGECCALVVFGFRSIHVVHGEYRANTEDARSIQNEFFPSAWSHIEAGMGLTKKIPVLVLADVGVSDGVFDDHVSDPLLERYPLDGCLDANKANVRGWLESIFAQPQGS